MGDQHRVREEDFVGMPMLHGQWQYPAIDFIIFLHHLTKRNPTLIQRERPMSLESDRPGAALGLCCNGQYTAVLKTGQYFKKTLLGCSAFKYD